MGFRAICRSFLPWAMYELHKSKRAGADAEKHKSIQHQARRCGHMMRRHQSNGMNIMCDLVFTMWRVTKSILVNVANKTLSTRKQDPFFSRVFISISSSPWNKKFYRIFALSYVKRGGEGRKKQSGCRVCEISMVWGSGSNEWARESSIK